jgi:hypothetical protein
MLGSNNTLKFICDKRLDCCPLRLYKLIKTSVFYAVGVFYAWTCQHLVMKVMKSDGRVMRKKRSDL